MALNSFYFNMKKLNKIKVIIHLIEFIPFFQK